MSGNGGWANPAPAGLVALAIACFTFYCILTGKVGHTAIPLLACWLLGGFVVQFTVAIIELKEGALLGGNVFLFFSGFFMLAGAAEFIVKAYFGTVHGAPIDTHIDGYAWIVLVTSLILWTPAYMKTGPALLSIAVILLDFACVIVAGTDGGWMAKTWSPMAGNLLGAAGCLAIYIAAAIQLNTAFGRTILPMPGPIL
ncbi:MAG: GPR1/FUN34/YaaH family transporter [Syntrophomonadaceae bacterium]|nr:GPR1/FUN34/YaaH family transporter [Syntrophomonadaceae bacterium]